MMQHAQEDPTASGEEDDAFGEGKVIFYQTNPSPAQTRDGFLGGIFWVSLKLSVGSKVIG